MNKNVQLAQLVERQSTKLKVAGSSPALDLVLFFEFARLITVQVGLPYLCIV